MTVNADHSFRLRQPSLTGVPEEIQIDFFQKMKGQQEIFERGGPMALLKTGEVDLDVLLLADPSMGRMAYTLPVAHWDTGKAGTNAVVAEVAGDVRPGCESVDLRAGVGGGAWVSEEAGGERPGLDAEPGSATMMTLAASVIVAIIKYSGKDYIPTDEIVGDVISFAAVAGIGELSNYLLPKVTRVLAKNGLKLGWRGERSGASVWRVDGIRGDVPAGAVQEVERGGDVRARANSTYRGTWRGWRTRRTGRGCRG